MSGSVVVLLVVSLVASGLPAWRASRVDALKELKQGGGLKATVEPERSGISSDSTVGSQFPPMPYNASAVAEPASTSSFPGSATDTTEIEHPRPRLHEGRLRGGRQQAAGAGRPPSYPMIRGPSTLSSRSLSCSE